MATRLIADLRYAVRTIARAPSFALAVIGVLALGIGANTAIFSIVNAVLLRPLPFEQPDRLVRIFSTPPQEAFPGQTIFALAPGQFFDWQRDARSFEGMALYRDRQFALTGTGSARVVDAAAVSAGFFEVVGFQPALGRLFRAEEDHQGSHRVVILSDRFWRSELGSAPDAIGRSLTLGGEPYTIVGVLPANASMASWTAAARDLWVPLALSPAQRAERVNHNQRGVARLRPDVSLDTAQSELRDIAGRLALEHPGTDAGWGAAVVEMQEEIVGDSRAMLAMLLGAVSLVLLIACANVGNLLFARGLTRRKEIAVRSALGAGRGRVFQQLLMEALLLASVGGGLGLLLAQFALTSASALLANQVPRAEEASIDARVLLFVAGVSLFTGVVAGTLPALRAGRSDLAGALKEGGRSQGALGVRMRRALIVCEVALSLVLLMGAGVMVQSLVGLRHGDTGFDADNVLTMQVSLAAARYPEASQRTTFFDTAVERLRALPGVVAAGTVDDVPLVDGSFQPLVVEGSAASEERNRTLQVRRVTPGYLRAMGIPVLRGRDVKPDDADVLLVSREAARLFWGDEDPLERRASLPMVSAGVLRQVVGIVGDVKQLNLSQPPAPTVYYYSRERNWGSATIVLRTAVPPATLARPAAAAIRALDPQQPVEEVRTMTDVIDERLTSERFSALLLGLFAGVALLLASMGIYSVLSYIVRGRSREIGIRTAFGARTADVLRLVIAEGMLPTLLGIAAGVAGALASAQVLETLVFGISASDPLTLLAVAVTLTLVALLATLVPAYRASRIDPLKVLRAE